MAAAGPVPVDGVRGRPSGPRSGCCASSPPHSASCSCAAATGSAPSSTTASTIGRSRRAGPQPGTGADPRASSAGERGAATDLGRLLDTAARLVRRRSLVVLISDFITEPGWERPLLRLTERNEVVAVRLVDPREYELPDAGLLFVQDAETGEQLLVDSSDPELRRRLLAVAEEQDAADPARRRPGPASTST